MRIRSIRPEFWRSSDISALPLEDRLLFIGLWSYVDDNGVGIDKLSAIVADLFADDLETDASETFARVSRGIQNLSERGRIIRYTVEGKPFLEISNWSKHQRIDKPGKARFPKSDHGSADIRESVASLPEKDPIGEGEKGRRGEGVNNTCSPAPPSSESDPTPEQKPFALEIVEEAGPDPFDEFWEHYPNKRGKQAARTKFATAAKQTDPRTIIAGAARLAADPNLPEPKYIPHPQRWLNEKRWNDPALPPRIGNSYEQAQQQSIANARDAYERAQQGTRRPSLKEIL